MPVRLTTTITNISSVPNPTNRTLLNEFNQYMKSIGTPDSYQNGNLKIMIYFAKSLGLNISLYDIRKKDQKVNVLSLLLQITDWINRR